MGILTNLRRGVNPHISEPKPRFSSNSLGYRADIQIIRGVSVIAVILFHTFKNSFPNGYLGVDAFFVVSGFVVTPLISEIASKKYAIQQLAAYKSFLVKRFFRLFPALSTTLIGSSLAILFFARISDITRFSRQGILSIFSLGNFGAYRFQPDYFSQEENILVHTWSLSIEGQFYVLAPVAVIILGMFAKKKKWIKLIVIAAVFFLSLSFYMNFGFILSIYNGIGISDPVAASFYLIFGRIWQFLAGGLLHYWKIRLFNIKGLFWWDPFCVVLSSPLEIDHRISGLLVVFLAG
ncbi:MAG: hypothetical protein RLZZ295_875, partial [Actinomycetota bacterium]